MLDSAAVTCGRVLTYALDGSKPLSVELSAGCKVFKILRLLEIRFGMPAACCCGFLTVVPERRYAAGVMEERRVQGRLE